MIPCISVYFSFTKQAMLTSGGSLNGDKFAQAKVFDCHVHAPPIHPNTVGLEGNAYLYKLAEGVFTVATNNHVISTTDSNFLVNIVFTFEGLGQFRLSNEEIQFCTTNKELDATVIELTDACVNRLQQFGAKFIKVTTTSGAGPVGELFIDTKSIQEIKDNKDVYYYFGGAFARDGSPILIWDYRANGKHKESASSIEHGVLVPIRNGNHLLAITVSQLADLRYL